MRIGAAVGLGRGRFPLVEGLLINCPHQTVVVWGSNVFDQCNSIPAGLSGVMAVGWILAQSRLEGRWHRGRLGRKLRMIVPWLITTVMRGSLSEAEFAGDFLQNQIIHLT